jgi:hypothetical protein
MIRAELNKIAAAPNQKEDTANCERLLTCPFFTGVLKMPSVEVLMKATYCHGDKTQCGGISSSLPAWLCPLTSFPTTRNEPNICWRAIRQQRRSF